MGGRTDTVPPGRGAVAQVAGLASFPQDLEAPGRRAGEALGRPCRSTLTGLWLRRWLAAYQIGGEGVEGPRRPSLGERLKEPARRMDPTHRCARQSRAAGKS